MEYYLAIKRNKILQHRWTLKTCEVKEASHKSTPVIQFIQKKSKISKSTKTENRLVASGYGEEERGVIA